MLRHYRSGTYCHDIGCERHFQLEQFSGDEYLRRKSALCRDCRAWLFLVWLHDRRWSITLPPPEVPSKELAARIKGIDPSLVEDLTEDDILCL